MHQNKIGIIDRRAEYCGREKNKIEIFFRIPSIGSIE